MREYVLPLTAPLLGHPYVLYLTSVDNALALTDRNLFGCGTINPDRGVPKELLDSVKQRALAGNELRFRLVPTTKPNQPLSVVVFHNPSAGGFYVFSNIYDPTETEFIYRRKKGVASLVPKDAPVAVADFEMGYVDSMNHKKVNFDLALTYKHRWYMVVIFYVLELSIINALVVLSQFCHEQLSHVDFRRQLAIVLVAREKQAKLAQRAPLGPFSSRCPHS